MDRDKRHLKILSIIHVIYGSVMLPFTSFGSLWAYRAVNEMVKANDIIPEAVGTILVGTVFLTIPGSLIFVLCILLTGRFLAHCKRYQFCFNLALFESLYVPFGTIIGISTILILRRDSVKALFSTSKEETGSS